MEKSWKTRGKLMETTHGKLIEVLEFPTSRNRLMGTHVRLVENSWKTMETHGKSWNSWSFPYCRCLDVQGSDSGNEDIRDSPAGQRWPVRLTVIILFYFGL